MTTANLSLFRQNLVEKVAAAQIAREQVKKQVLCVHEWKNFKQTVQSDNPNFTGEAYLIVKACVKCHIKEFVNYILKR